MSVKIFHHNDADGYVAAYQVYKYYENSYSVTDIEFHEMDYNKKFPINDINEEDMIIIVDFSIEPSEMLDLLRINKNVIWIDHHITAINKYDEWMSLIKEATGVDRIEGLRYNGLAGCELTWLFYNGYFKDESEIDLDKALYILEVAPLYIQLTGDWDVWRHRIEYTKPFMIALSNRLSMKEIAKLDKDAYELVKLKHVLPDKEVLTQKLELDSMTYLKELINIGSKYIEYRTHWSEQLRNKYGFTTEIIGPDGDFYSAYCLNVGNANSEFFGIEIDKYDVVISMCFDGTNWNYSMYSNKPNVHCGEICRYLGVDNGGGHKGAAGFRHKDLLFKK